MKCVNMKVVNVLLLLGNAMMINASEVRQNKATLTKIVPSGEVSKSKSSQDCSHLLETIHENKLSDWMSNCKVINKTNSLQNKESVLQHACFVLQNMLSVVCSKRVDETSLNLLARDSINNICPFDFVHLEFFDVFENHEIIKSLENENFCQKVCYELYSTEVQCVLLEKFNNYLKSRVAKNEMNEELYKTVVKPHITDINVQEASKTVNKQSNQQNQLNQKQQMHSIQPQLSQSNQHHSTQVNQPQVVKSNQPEKIESKQPQAIESNQSQPIELVSQNENKEQAASLKERNPSRLSTESMENLLQKEKKTEKTVATQTSRKEPTIIENMDVPKVNTKVQEAENYEENIKSEEKLQDDLPNEENNLQIVNDMDLNRANPSQELEFQKALSSPVKENPFVKEKETFIGEGFSQTEDSHFFFYFIMVSSVVVVGYLAFHNKNKILAYALEGSSSRRSRRRPNPARYRKLETNLEEVMSSGASNAATSSVVY